MVPHQIQQFPEAAALEAYDPSILVGGRDDRGELTLEVASNKITAACECFRARGYHLLSSITATDAYPVEPRFRLVYQLYCLTEFKHLRLVAQVGGQEPQVDSVISVWPAADWYEREVFDLFGVRFRGHPNLTRILMPEDWEGHPLRKDFPTEGIR